MSYSTASAEKFSAKIKAQLNKDEVKAFFVDYSKACTMKALISALSSKESQLFLVENRVVANDFLTLLEPALGTFTLVDSMAKLKEILQAVHVEMEGEQEQFVSEAQAFKKRFPRLIFTFKDEDMGGDLFHAVLCKDGTKNGVYVGENKKGDFCVSDLLSTCAYECVVIDDVYKYLSFEKPKAYDKKQFDCGEYERTDFLGETYYTHRSYSYKRLKNMASVAKKCIVMSDVIVNSEAVELYMVLDILHENFSLQKAREKVSKMSDSYEAECEELVANLSFIETDQSVLSLWLRSLKNIDQTVPGDMESIAQYLSDNFLYMSYEERFLRAVMASIEANFNGHCSSVNKVLDALENSQSMVNMLKQMFFSNVIKGELERVLNHGRINQMSETELAGLYEVFSRYGVCNGCGEINTNSVKILRFKREDCGFEYFASQMMPMKKDDEYTYSILRSGSAKLYKAIALQKMLDGRDNVCAAKAPVLIVTRENVAEVQEAIEKTLTDCALSSVRDLTKDTQNTAAVISYKEYMDIPLHLHVNTVVFFDVLPDVVTMRNAVDKALYFGSKYTYALADYANMNGYFMDEWQDSLFGNTPTLPINGTQINLKESKEIEYCEIICQLDNTYRALNELTHCGGKDCVQNCIENYNKIITEYTLRMTSRERILQRDFAYLASLTKEYQAIFENSITVGGEGEKVLSEALSHEKVVKTAQKSKSKVEEFIEKTEVSENRYIFFNACASMLFRNCDWRLKNCNGCDGYKQYFVNDFDCFKQSIETLFTQTKDFIEKAEKYEWIHESDEVIKGDPEENKDRLVMDEIVELENEAKAILGKIQYKRAEETLFWVDYASVHALQEIVCKAYSKLLQKYYLTIIEIYKTATEKAKASFGVINSKQVVASSKA